MPTIAAIIPLYNGALYIEQAVESVFAQDLPADEIIVVDDGSSDDGPDIVQALARENKALRLLRKANGGQGSARNLGVASASCDLIAFLDQDDYWYADHLSVLHRVFVEKNDGKLAYVYSNPDRVAVDGALLNHRVLSLWKNQEHPKTSLMSCLVNDMFVLPGSSLISRQIFLDIGGFDEQFRGYEDDDLFVRIFCAGYRAEYIDRALYAWRDNPSSVSYSRSMIIARTKYFEKLSDRGLLENLSRSEKSIVAQRFARPASREIKLAIRRGDADDIERLLPHAMKATRDMLPLSRFLLRSKIRARYVLFRLRKGLTSMVGC